MDPIDYLIPAFFGSVAAEAYSIHTLMREQLELGRDEGLVGYTVEDARTSIAMGIGYTVLNAGWRFAALACYNKAYEKSPFKLRSDDWRTWVFLFLADDLIYYAYHRAVHRVRVMWAGHVVHHSSQHFNLSTALRQKWTVMYTLPFWLPLPLLGVPVPMVYLAQTWSLTYQFLLHTEVVRKLPAWFEAVFNTPSHHRAHHGSDPEYIDVNYGGVLIVWDKLFKSFEPEVRRPTYGLIKNIDTYNPFKVATHEVIAMVKDVKASRDWKAKLMHVVGPPGWKAATASIKESLSARVAVAS